MEVEQYGRYIAAVELLLGTESSSEDIAKVKKYCEIAAKTDPFVEILYGLLAKGREGVSACKRPKEGVTSVWLKQFNARCASYNHAMGALAISLSKCRELEFETPTSPKPKKKRRFKVRKR